MTTVGETQAPGDGRRPVFAAERRRRIIELLRTNGAVSLRELADAVGSSEVTVRRDLRALEGEGLISRHHGGATLPGESSREPSHAQRAQVSAAEKGAIADLAASLVADGDAIVVGPGSTTQEFARRLTRHTELAVVTNSLLVAQELAGSPRIEVVLTGGTLRGSIHALVGSAAEHSLAGLRVRRAFVSGNGLTAERGLSTLNMQVAGMDRALAAAAEEVVVLADHTKIGVDTLVQTVALEQVGHLVTDTGAPGDVLDELGVRGVRLHVAHA
ncbi:DeoR/GlpR family DNA-binding transcription regulator [Spongiactinospora sp. TRM90649]|uniref:DeoR/GlpR family DNA-binding transcription regulator n=1 Tax=Spongiactinospora sp. TRM90649 TaxID=3031114 RepID=UPI0023F764FA|nr:DeoR/GlpR family DNA-binding transcription regulator [Spongiactinospora sp. TRM90649]MDF5757215.1 DeoR/GlpR family DNA-binding transcription regulator [Spongiactinospora sp. TRM90649]